MPFIKDISLRSKKAPAITFNNLYAWGSNSAGQIGDSTTTNKSSPVFIKADIVTVAGGGNYAHFIDTDGKLWSVGQNNIGQLGIGTSLDNRSSPVQVGSATDWYSVSANTEHSLAIKEYTSGGKLFAFGNNVFGRLGLGDTTDRSSPVQVGSNADWLMASAASIHSVAIRYKAGSNFEIGSLWAWGSDNFGRLGIGSLGNRSSPVQVGSDQFWHVVSAGNSHTLALKWDAENTGDYSLWSWGTNNSGQLGLGDTISRNSPVQIGSNQRYISISAGLNICAAIKEDNTLWTWGLNNSGQLGDGTTTNRSSPVQVSGTSWYRVSCSHNFMVALKTDGTLWAWGINNEGQLGVGDTTNRSSPVQIGALTSWILPAEIFTPSTLSLGQSFSLAIETGG